MPNEEDVHSSLAPFSLGFGVFNLQMAPPKWAKAATDLSKVSKRWRWLFDDSEAGQNRPMHEQSDYFYVEDAEFAGL